MTNTLMIAIVAMNTCNFTTNTFESGRGDLPNEKWVTTVITKNDVLSFEWNGQQRQFVDSTMISSNSVHYAINPIQWKEIP